MAKAATKKTKATDESAPRRLGDVISDGGILVAEGEVAATYKGGAKLGEKGDVAPLAIGKATGLLLRLGNASVWMTEDGRLVLVETSGKKSEASAGFHDFVTAAPKAKKASGTLKLKNADDWTLVLSPTSSDCSGVSKIIKKWSSSVAQPFGPKDGALLLSVWATQWKVFVDAPVKGAWGSARRAVLVPTM